MVTFLLTSAIILSILVVAVYFWQKPRTEPESSMLPPHSGARGLFTGEQLPEINNRFKLTSEDRKTEIVRAAGSGDKNALRDAHEIGDRSFYNEVLDRLSAGANTDPQLLSLISFVTRSELPVNTRLATRMLESWKNSPDRSGTAKALHIVALSNDASLYNTAVEEILQLWRAGRLPEVSAQELASLFDGEFWLLSSEVRGSGPGFLLKRTLAKARDELNAKAR